MYKAETGIESFTGLPQFKELPKLKFPSDWFDIYMLPHDVYAIYEPYHPQKVFSFLIIGSQKAMLLDSGMGVASMKDVVSKLTDKPITLVNTHSHYDHIGCNHEFGKTHLFDYAPAIKIVEEGLDLKAAQEKLDFGTDVVPDVVYPKGFDPMKFSIPGSKVIPVHEGDIFDLGDRTLTVWHTPGHSPDSIMLSDDKNKILFTGDTLYPGKLYAFSTDKVMGSDIPTYVASLRRMYGMFKDYTLYCQHCEAVRDAELIRKAADALELMLDPKGMEYEIADEGLKRYMFDGFSILQP